MTDVTAGGVRFHVQRLRGREASTERGAADAGTVVFLHGLLIDDLSSLYYTLANPVAKIGADVILYDLRGHGLSERTPAGYSLTDSITDLGALLDALGVSGPVHLVGNSYGSTLALGFTLAHPERVATLVLVEAHVPFEDDYVPGLDPREWAEGMIRALEPLLARSGGVLGPRVSARHRDARLLMDALLMRPVPVDALDGERVPLPLEALLARSGRRRGRLAARVVSLVNETTLLADMEAVRPMAIDALRTVTCPVRAFYGEESDALDHGRRLEELLPRCMLTVVPECSHWVLGERTSLVRDAVLEWFASRAAWLPRDGRGG